MMNNRRMNYWSMNWWKRIKQKTFNLFNTNTMKTKQKLLWALLLVASTALGSVWYAAWTDNILPIEQLSDAVSCSNASKVYLNQDSDADGIPDFYLYLNSNFILNGNANNYTAGQILRESGGTPYTTVKYYTPLSNMLYKINDANQIWTLDDTTFWRASRVFPYNTPVRGIATTPNKVVFEQPSDNDPNKNTVSFIYDYRYKYAVGFDGNSNSAYRYNQVPSMNRLVNTGLSYITTLPGSQGNRKRARSAVQSISTTDTICRNYELHRCGNNIIDTSDNSYVSQFTWEICDEWTLNGTPGHCNATCSGIWGWTERCGDEIVQPEGVYYNWTPETPENMSFETCDDGDELWDTDGVINGDDPATAFCSTICLPTFSEAFTEEFVNG